MMELTQAIRVRFASKHGAVPGECWIWQGRRNRQGYGLFDVGRKTRGAHRVSYEIHVGTVGYLDVLHRCDRPECVNPGHLFLGTDLDNAADREAKGRGNHQTGDRNGARTKPDRRPRGMRNGSAKLSDDQVAEIRRAHACGEATYGDLASAFGIHRSHLSLLILGTQRKPEAA
jgi:hypothetical protein